MPSLAPSSSPIAAKMQEVDDFSKDVHSPQSIHGLAIPAESPREIQRGRLLILGIGAFTIGMSVLTIVYVNADRGNSRLPQQLFRLAMTVTLAIFLYRGHEWARKVLVVLYSIAGIFALVVLRSDVPIPSLMTTACVVVMSIGYLGCATVLRNSSSVREFMSSQRALRLWP